MKKTTFLVGAVLFTIVFYGYHYVNQQQPTDNLQTKVSNQNQTIHESIISNTIDINPVLKLDNQLTEEIESTDTRIVNLQKSVDKKNEIEQLMLNFDTHKANKQQRQSIKQKIDKAMQEYNRLILPIALTQIEQNQ